MTQQDRNRLEPIASILDRVAVEITEQQISQENKRKTVRQSKQRTGVTIEFAKDAASFWDELLGEVVEG